MAKKQAVTIFVDPDEETTVVIKPFSAGLATPMNIDGQDASADGWTGTASATHTPQGNDADVDADYSG